MDYAGRLFALTVRVDLFSNAFLKNGHWVLTRCHEWSLFITCKYVCLSPMDTHVALGFVLLIREKAVGGSANGSGRRLLDTLLPLVRNFI